MPVPYITEEEALEKWCPFARGAEAQTFYAGAPIRSAPSVNRVKNTGDGATRGASGAQGHSYCKCIGSQCAKWDVEKQFNDLTGRGRCGA